MIGSHLHFLSDNTTTSRKGKAIKKSIAIIKVTTRKTLCTYNQVLISDDTHDMLLSLLAE